MVHVDPLDPTLGRAATGTVPEPTAPPRSSHHFASAVAAPGVAPGPDTARPDAAHPATPQRILQQIDRLVATGGRNEAVSRIVELVGRDRRVLEDVHLTQVQRMHRLPVDDFNATAVLRAIEAALATLPRRPTVEQPDRRVARRTWWRRRRGRSGLDRPRRRTATATGVVLLASALAACGGGDNTASVDPARTRSRG